ncbi:MAG: hypothetical protein O2913_00025 [Chloroflexi bacterium]|nr:hypothetical protein [Chloroflexota bacterium]
MAVADLVVKSPDDNVALIVEVKARFDVTDEWASTLHRNLVIHGWIPSTAYFLLALPDFFTCGSRVIQATLTSSITRFRQKKYYLDILTKIRFLSLAALVWNYCCRHGWGISLTPKFRKTNILSLIG